jgi:hypothetical protein
MGRVTKAENGCWLWGGAKNKRTGYGKFHDGPKTLLVHRASFLFFVGEIPSGLFVLHANHEKCGSRLCINPNHLRLGTALENQLDRKRDGTDCSGREHYASYSEDVVKKAIAMYMSGVPKRHVAKHVGVHESTVRAWVSGFSVRGNKVLKG